MPGPTLGMNKKFLSVGTTRERSEPIISLRNFIRRGKARLAQPNKGFALVEVLTAIVIMTVCLTTVVRSLLDAERYSRRIAQGWQTQLALESQLNHLIAQGFIAQGKQIIGPFEVEASAAAFPDLNRVSLRLVTDRGTSPEVITYLFNR